MEKKQVTNWQTVGIGLLLVIATIIFPSLVIFWAIILLLFFRQKIHWKAVGIGIVIGFSVIVLGFIGFVLANKSGEALGFAMFFSIIGIPFCIAGALIGNYLKAKTKAIWMGAVIGSLPISFFLIVFLNETGGCFGMC